MSEAGRPWTVWRSLTELWPLAADRRGTLASIVALGLASTFFEGAGLGLIVVLINALIGLNPGPLPGPLSGLADDVPLLVILVGATLLVRSTLTGVYVRLTADISSTVTSRARKALFANFMRVSYDYVTRRGIGTMLAALDGEAPFVADLLNEIAGLLINGCAILVYGCYLAALSFKVALLAAGFAGPVLLALWLPGRLLRPLSAQWLARYQAHSDIVVAALGAMRTLRLLDAQAAEIAVEAKASDALAATEQHIARRRSWIRPVQQIVMALFGGAFLLALVLQHVAQGQLVAILAILFRAVSHFAALDGHATQIASHAAAVASAAEAIAATAAERAAAGGQAYDGRFEEVRFEEVGFAYPGQPSPALASASAVFRRGSVSLLVGPSGSGKTTLVNLIGRLAEPTAGRITVDGRGLSGIDRTAWLAHTAFAGQDVELISGSIFDNIRLGRPEVGRQDALDALRIAGAMEIVDALPLGLDSRIGDRGLRLSGGQRQRIVLARALARAPTLLILDEAANAVQPSVERSILAAIRRHRPDLTLIIVTHRGDVADIDQALGMADGRLRTLAREPESVLL